MLSDSGVVGVVGSGGLGQNAEAKLTTNSDTGMDEVRGVDMAMRARWNWLNGLEKG